MLDKKRAIQKDLAIDILPTDQDLEKFKTFLKAAEEISAFELDKGAECPFCKRLLDEDSVELIKKYTLFLASDLEQEIKKLETQIMESERSLKALKLFDASNFTNLPPELEHSGESLKESIATIQRIISEDAAHIRSIDILAYNQYKKLAEVIQYFDKEIQKRKTAIEIVESEKNKYIEKRTQLKQQIARYQYAKLFAEHREKITDVLTKIKDFAFLERTINQTNFATL